MVTNSGRLAALTVGARSPSVQVRVKPASKRRSLCAYQQLGDLAPVRAVLALGGLELYGPHDVTFSLREEQNYPVSRDPRPPVAGSVYSQGREAAERRALGDAGDQQRCQLVELIGRKPIHAPD